MREAASFKWRPVFFKANDEDLRGVLAHEIAHDDLGHVARAQTLGIGLNIGVILLEQLFPGSSAVTPIAGALIANSYSRSEELAADRHGVEILRRASYSKKVMDIGPVQTSVDTQEDHPKVTTVDRVGTCE